MSYTIAYPALRLSSVEGKRNSTSRSRCEGEAQPVSCRLFHASIDNLPGYEALSCTWGTDPSDRVIHITEGSLAVKPNLEAALRQLRQDPTSQTGPGFRRIWIDAICINQDDLDERSHQVMLMCQIYTFSSRLIVWLDVADEDNNIAIDFIATNHQKREKDDATLDAWLVELFQCPQFKSTFQALSRFLGRPGVCAGSEELSNLAVRCQASILG